jgi:PAS domain S-box-containing protein
MWGIPSHVMATGSHVAALEVVRNQLPDPQQFENRIMELYAYSDQTSQEEIVLKDGRVFDRYSAPVKDSDGTHYGRVWYYRDITAFKQAQDALRASEQKFRTLVESMDDIIFTLDREQRHTGVFGRWLERYGLSADFFLGKTSRETSIDDTVAAAHEAANERALTGEYVVYEWSVGEPPFYVQTSLSPVHNEQGDVMGLVGVGRDITRLKRMEEALRESNRRIGNILESITDAFFALDHDYRFVYMNQRAADLLQHNRDDLLGKVLWNEFPDAVNLAFYQQYHLAMIGQVTVNFEEFYPALNTWYEMHVYPSDDGLAVYFQDITERKRVEEELKRHNRELAALNLVTEAVNLFLDLPDVLVTLQVLLAEHLHIAAGAIFLYHEHEEEAYLSLEMAWGLPVHMKETFTHLAVAGAHNEPVVRDQVPILLNNMHLESPALYATLHTSQSAWHSYLGVPILAQGEIQGVMDLFSETSAHFTDDQVAFFATLGQQVGTAIQNARLFDEVCMGRERLQTLSYRLLEVQEEERRTVAMELHDEIGQILTGLNLSLELAARVPPEQLSERLAYASELVNDLMLRVREMSLELRPPMLDDLGLLAALLWQFEQYTAQTTIQVIFKHRNMEQRFAPEIEVAFYRMIQEALTNVARHADVSEVVVRLWSSNGVIGLHIEDQGKGFNPDTAFSNHTSSGLSGLRERVLLLNGKLSIDSEPGQGSCLAVEIPLRRELYDHNSSC